MEARLLSTGKWPAPVWNTPGGLLEAADLAVETLRAVSLQFSHHPQPTRRFLYRESVSSSRMAGSQSTLLDLLCFQETPEFLAPHAGVLEQSQYLAALSFGLEGLAQGTFNEACIQQIFGLLCPETVSKIDSGVPPPWAQIMDFVTGSADLHPLLQSGLLHWYVMTSAPFPVANDRMARILSTLLLAKQKNLMAPCLCLSPFFESQAETYTQHLQTRGEAADLSAWLAFFLEGARQQALDSTHRLHALLEIMAQYRTIMLRQGKGTRSAFKVMEHLIHIPLLTARTLMEKVGLSAPTAQRALQLWVEAGVIQELTGHRSGRIYLATDLFHLGTEEWQVRLA